MKIKGIEHCDELGDVYVFWIELTEIEENLIQIGKEIDKENFSNECFGMCMQHNNETKEIEIITEDIDDKEIFYVDNEGNKHWINYKISEEIFEEARSLCIKELMGDN